MCTSLFAAINEAVSLGFANATSAVVSTVFDALSVKTQRALASPPPIWTRTVSSYTSTGSA